jgi:hypothetical protein
VASLCLIDSMDFPELFFVLTIGISRLSDESTLCVA